MTTKSLERRSSFFPALFNDFFEPWMDSNMTGMLTVPSVNIRENENDFRISLAAPGMKKNDFNIDIDGNIITISAEKEENKEEKDDMYNRREYNYSSFSRSFNLPEEVMKDKIEAHYENGVLDIMIPKKAEAKGKLSRKIAIK